jgi:hypothetical protein
MAPSVAFIGEMEKKRNTRPKTKIEFVDKLSNVTDITSYFISGANLEAVKERAPDEIQAGQFDVVLSNHDNKFSEYIPTSLFYGMEYHGTTIKIYQGFILPDGTEEYLIQGVGFVDQLITDPKSSRVTLRCRDRMWRIMDEKIHLRPALEVPVADGGNVGTGYASAIETRPFYTVNQNWTITCTLGGGDGVATFSVVGSISGNVGTATSGAEFKSNTAGIKFTIHVGGFNWVVGDKFTFTSYKHPQWAGVNAAKIIWSILTGYNWDTDTIENWSVFVFNFDHTKTSANVDLDYDSFVAAISFVDDIGVFNLHGYANYDTNAISFLQEILVIILGSLFTGNDGRIKLKVYNPQPGSVERLFKDSEKITTLSYNRSIDEVINSVSVQYLSTPNWVFSDESLKLDGAYATKDAPSITEFKELGVSFSLNWYTATGEHARDFAIRLVTRYKTPPLNVSFDTGMDALETEIGDFISVTDEKLGLNAIVGEVASVKKSFDTMPTKISLMIRRDAVIEQIFGYVGSSVNEGDGLSPQSDDYDTSSVTDKDFAYVGNASPGNPDYRIY